MAVVDNLDELFEGVVEDAGLEREATAQPTAPTGQYNIMVNRITPVEGEEGRFDAGRKYAMLNAPIQVARENGAQTLGFIGIAVAPTKYFRKDRETGEETGNLEDMSRNYGQLKAALRALDVDVDNLSPTELIQATLDNPIRVSITRTYRTDEGWRSLKAGEENSDREVEWKKSGYDVKNFLRKILTYREE